jgi:hypothetical protein
MIIVDYKFIGYLEKQVRVEILKPLLVSSRGWSNTETPEELQIPFISNLFPHQLKL